MPLGYVVEPVSKYNQYSYPSKFLIILSTLSCNIEILEERDDDSEVPKVVISELYCSINWIL